MQNFYPRLLFIKEGEKIKDIRAIIVVSRNKTQF